MGFRTGHKEEVTCHWAYWQQQELRRDEPDRKQGCLLQKMLVSFQYDFW